MSLSRSVRGEGEGTRESPGQDAIARVLVASTRQDRSYGDGQGRRIASSRTSQKKWTAEAFEPGRECVGAGKKRFAAIVLKGGSSRFASVSCQRSPPQSRAVITKLGGATEQHRPEKKFLAKRIKTGEQGRFPSGESGAKNKVSSPAFKDGPRSESRQKGENQGTRTVPVGPHREGRTQLSLPRKKK